MLVAVWLVSAASIVERWGFLENSPMNRSRSCRLESEHKFNIDKRVRKLSGCVQLSYPCVHCPHCSSSCTLYQLLRMWLELVEVRSHN